MNTNVIIYGSGHLGIQVLHYIEHYSDVNVLGFIDDTKSSGDLIIGELKCLGGFDDLVTGGHYPPEQVDIVFAIGYSNMLARKMALDRLLASDYSLFGLIHPRAIVEPGTTIGRGVIILGGAILDQRVSVGDGCYVDIGVRIGEDSIVAANNYLSSGSAIGGDVAIGESNFFGMDCTVTTGVSIGSNCFINAKTLVARNLGSDVQLVEIHKSKELPRT